MDSKKILAIVVIALGILLLGILVFSPEHSDIKAFVINAVGLGLLGASLAGLIFPASK